MDHSWDAMTIGTVLVGLFALGIHILLWARRRVDDGTPQVAKRDSHSGVYQAIAAALILLVGLPILWIGGSSLLEELSVFWKLERKTIQVAEVYAEHTKSFHENGVSYSLDVVLAGNIDGVPRELRTSISASGSLLDAKAQFEALRGREFAIWTAPGSSRFRLRREFFWDGIPVGLLGLAFVAVSVGALIQGWRERFQP